MTSNDPFEFDDAAYVLGALAPAERAAFEQHLQGCPDCTARVREVSGVPALLAGITADELTAPEASPPDTLLPGLLRRAATRQRRQRWLVAGLAAVAAACLIALVVVAWPTSSPAPKPVPAAQAFVPVGASPVQATATLTAKAWGTGIELHCRYVSDDITRGFSYDLVVYGKDGTRENLGSWSLPPERDIEFPAGTSLPKNKIARIEITLPNGQTVLRLTT
jgi:putative zinc finger protein